MTPFSLAGRRAFVTGANSGIGQAIAQALAAMGAAVTCAGRTEATQTVAAIRAAGGQADTLHLDLADPMAAQDMFAGQEYTILVNNAGIILREDSMDYPEDMWDRVMDVNLKSVFFTSQAFARALPEAPEAASRGAIVHVASVLSFQGGIRVPSYAAAKHGVAGLAKSMANEWASQRINVNAIAPGYGRTKNTASLTDDPDRYEAILLRIPASRWGGPGDIDWTAAFLCSPAAAYINGAVINVDGGWLAR